MITWQDHLRKVKDHPGESKAWKSDQKSLMKIFSAAETMRINPECVDTEKMSNLQAIVKRAKKAISMEDKHGLEELFLAAKSLTHSDLRLKLKIPNLEDIKYRMIQGVVYPKYQIVLSQEQFDRIQKSTKLQFRFLPEEQEK